MSKKDTEFGRLFSSLREKAHLTQAQLLAKLGEECRVYGKATISKWENGYQLPRDAHIDALEEILQTTKGILFKAAHKPEGAEYRRMLAEREVESRLQNSNKLGWNHSSVISDAKEKHLSRVHKMLMDWRDEIKTLLSTEKVRTIMRYRHISDEGVEDNMELDDDNAFACLTASDIKQVFHYAVEGESLFPLVLQHCPLVHEKYISLKDMRGIYEKRVAENEATTKELITWAYKRGKLKVNSGVEKPIMALSISHDMPDYECQIIGAAKELQDCIEASVLSNEYFRHKCDWCP